MEINSYNDAVNALKMFETAANNVGEVGKKSAIVLSGTGDSVNVSTTDKPGLLGKLFRSQSDMNANNETRKTFMTALKVMLNASNESEVARKIGNNLKLKDFGLDAEGHVTSGKPLTARRISAVLNAVRELHIEEPKVEAPKIEQPKPEQPKVEQPKVDQPKVDQPKVEEPKIEQPKPEQPKVDQPKVDQPKVEEPKIEQPKPEPVKTEAPKVSVQQPKFESKKFKKLPPEIKLKINDKTTANSMLEHLNMSALKNPKELGKLLEKAVSTNQIRGHRDDYIYGAFASEDEGMLGKCLENPNVPGQFGKDFARTTSFKLPGVGEVRYKTSDELEKATDDFTESITQGRVKKFKDLQGKDLQLVRFAMTVMCQSSVSMAVSFAAQVPFKKDEYGYEGAFQVDGRKTKISYECKFENGGLTFIGNCHQPITQIECDEDTYGVNKDTSSLKMGVTLHYTAEQIDKICTADLENMKEVDRLDLFTAKKREFNVNIEVHD